MKTEINVKISVQRHVYKGKLPAPPLRRLELVPYYGAALGLHYDPQDLAEDRPLRFYRRTRHPLTGLARLTELAVYAKDCNAYYRKRGSKRQPMMRRYIVVTHKGKSVTLLCSHLTLLCVTGFLPADRRHNVVMHLNGDCMDDRPGNLRYGTQSENMRMSEKIREHCRKNAHKANAAWVEKCRQRRLRQEGGGHGN